MNCLRCNNTLAVREGLCVHCRIRKKRGLDGPETASFFINHLGSLFFVASAFMLMFLIGSRYDFALWEKRSAPGMQAPEDPLQVNGNYRSWNHKGYLFKPVAQYTVKARVLLKSNYWMSPNSDLSPIDLTLGWGPMSDQSVLDKLTIGSCNRCYYWSAKELPIPQDEINRHAANTHIIPKDEKILKKLKSLSPGDVVELSGYLVNISKADGWHWNTSTIREDSGGGACELMWVESVNRF